MVNQLKNGYFCKKKVYDTVIIQGVNGISNELKDTLRLGKVQTVIYMNSSTSMLAKICKNYQNIIK